jgi:hypothetical protein
MNPSEFLNLKTFPARLNSEQAAWLIGCQPHNIPALVAAKQIKPLGKPVANAVKYFCAEEILELCKDRNWLGRVTTVIQNDWARRNARYRPPAGKTAPSDRQGNEGAVEAISEQ